MTVHDNPVRPLGWNTPGGPTVSVAELFGYSNPEHPDYIAGTEQPTAAEWTDADEIAAEYDLPPLTRTRPDETPGNRAYLRAQLRRALRHAGVDVIA